MNEKKLDRAIKCLYALAAIKVGTTLYTVLSLTNSWSDVSFYVSSVSFSAISKALLFGLTVAVFSVVTAKKLREQKMWAWISAISLFLFSTPSFALPACILGLLSLLDIEVREHFIKELDIKL